MDFHQPAVFDPQPILISDCVFIITAKYIAFDEISIREWENEAWDFDTRVGITGFIVAENR